ncbi:unnamed protein product [Notodromas monacha]|uniref:VWFA domain-containing protein n=1 Tax=Notodromas monacha TaxID=399045 RepID=A0A7R9BLG4_9CRUS|nr:unnamed protein product [Notodromas monacha]CAG0917399.1 unnamed protein product [Notodromas monacha]
MTIIAFLVDTSASMNQRTIAGGRPTLLDMAKIAIESFIKMRSKKLPEASGDRYMLLTFEEPPSHIKVGWKEGMNVLMHELKNLHAIGMTTLGAALKNTFDLINLNRMQSGVDTFGQGRNPTYMEPAVVVVLTDGERLTDVNGVKEELSFPSQPQIPGADLCRDIYRWDQRVFALVLRLSGAPCGDSKEATLVPSDRSPVDGLCEQTGGRSYCITSHRMMMQCVESVVGKIQLGVVFHFERSGPDISLTDGITKSADALSLPYDPLNPEHVLPDNLRITVPGSIGNDSSRPLVPNPLAPAIQTFPKDWNSCRKMIYVNKDPKKGTVTAWWPVPENFWPDMNAQSLPPRTAQPHVKFSCAPTDFVNSDPVPFDRYELEASPLTLYILSRKMPHAVWQVFVSNSYKSNSETSHPFGYLKANQNLDRVNLFVLPYNYPVIVPLIQEAARMTRNGSKPQKEWRVNFDNYLRNTPTYYILPLKRALNSMKMPNLIPEHVEINGLSYAVCSHLKKVKAAAKTELDRINDLVAKQQAASQMNGMKSHGPTQNDSIRVAYRAFANREFVAHPALRDKFNVLHRDIMEFKNVMIPARQRKDVTLQKFRNAFDIPRRDLLAQVARMRTNFMQSFFQRSKLHEDDQLHSLSVSQMGNFQDALCRNPPLREVVESTLQRQHMFGNPFKVNKKMMMIDEADSDDQYPVSFPGAPALSSGNSSRQSLRRSASAANLDPLGLARPGSVKRKRGPIPRDFVYRPTTPRPFFSLFSAPASPAPVVIEEIATEPAGAASPLPNGDDFSVVYEFPLSPAPAVELVERLPAPQDPVIIAPLPPFVPNGIPVVSPAVIPEQSAVVEPVVPLLNGHVGPTAEEEVSVSISKEQPKVIRKKRGDFRVVMGPVDTLDFAFPIKEDSAWEVRRHNLCVRREIWRTVRNHSPDGDRQVILSLFDLRGSMETRIAFVDCVSREAATFCKRNLVQQLDKFRQILVHFSEKIKSNPPPVEEEPTDSVNCANDL